MSHAATLAIGRKLAILDLGAVFIEWLIVGTIIGLIYKPAAGSAR